MDRKKSRILVIAAHPDDEVLGCGGTIAKHSDQGDEVHILILAEGITSRFTSRMLVPADDITHLSAASNAAAKILGASYIELLKLPDNRLDSMNLLDITKLIEERIQRILPDTVYFHHIGDVNIDHRLLHQAVVVACRPTPGHSVKRMLSFETLSSTEWQPSESAPHFHPNWFVDISAQFERKQEALLVYQSELRTWPHPRSPEAVNHLARFRGSQVGVEAAEAFCMLRNIL